MEALFVGVALAAISGLAWLSYHHSQLASKILLGLICCNMIVQLTRTSYTIGYTRGWASYETSTTRVLDSLKSGQTLTYKSRDSVLAYNMVNSEDLKVKEKVRSISENNDHRDIITTTDYYFFFIYIVLGSLLLFSSIIPKYKKNDKIP